jgi:hypothetical protein
MCIVSYKKACNLAPVGAPLVAGMLTMKVAAKTTSLLVVLKLFDVTLPKIYSLLITQIVYNNFIDFMLISYGLHNTDSEVRGQ